MIKYKAGERKVDLYDIGNGLTLMNIILKNQDGRMTAIDTYIGEDRNGFSCVGHTERLDEPGVIFSYSRYVRMIEANLSYLMSSLYFSLMPRFLFKSINGCIPFARQYR